MKYEKSTYLEFSGFCKTTVNVVVKGLESIEEKRKILRTIIRVLNFIANILTLGMWAFVSLIIILSAGAIVYFTEISTFIAINPLLGAALLALGGGGIVLLRKEREIAFAVDEVVKKGYEEDYAALRNTLKSTEEIPKEYVHEIEALVGDAVHALAKDIAVKKSLSVSKVLAAIAGLE